jgi:hypothetical protein
MSYELTPNNSTPWQRYGSTERKKAFAAFLFVRPDTDAGRFEAACLTFPDQCDDNLARQAAVEYPFDREVIAELARLRTETDDGALPSRAEQARAIYNLAADNTRTVSDRLAAHKLYAELMGHVQKPSEAARSNNTYIDNRRIMVMPATPANADSWETQAVGQQAKLVADAASTRK